MVRSVWPRYFGPPCKCRQQARPSTTTATTFVDNRDRLSVAKFSMSGREVAFEDTIKFPYNTVWGM